MTEPKKLTKGHSSGPQAHWDSISDAKKDAEIERLRKENERLRGLLERCFPYISVSRMNKKDFDLYKEVESEVIDE